MSELYAAWIGIFCLEAKQCTILAATPLIDIMSVANDVVPEFDGRSFGRWL